ncbi:zinc finger FYVE domain-containing protein 1-like isoform X4 [Colletes gigas]|uniref:zinc finger FYVE domain-containing protein 1-like isoform X4 n=1 Tax=Colletes gigas TaxID=935657 RepID=UPI001C9A81C3|nr:zinc finger FYVE domain-containing protein 1-like isoform X4 [Colletes gigas]
MSGLWEKNKFEASGPAIMKSLNNICICDRDNSVSENGIPANGLYIKCSCRTFKSFLLIDEQEYLKVSTAKQFVEKLNCSAKDVKVKVVSVFGNIGDGKSHMLNQTFFKGKEVFKTSNKQNSCTIGVWAAFDPLLNVICLDTEDDLESAENILKTQFNQMKLETEAFSSIKYVGVQATNSTTDYRQFLTTIKNEINNTSVRSARHPRLVYDILKILNDRFSEKIDNFSNILFPDQYFTCPVKCLSCECRCSNSMGHLREGKPHCSSTRCQYQHQYENIMYTCKKCYDNGNEVQVTKKTENNSSWYGLVKYAWSGDVIDCPHCGEIYRSRQYWYGNKNPEEFVVRTEIVHVWNAAKNLVASQNTAQRVVDGVSYITEAVTNVSLQPTKMISAWVADQVAPSYWRPNNEIKHCHKCKTVFGPTDTKHHCRACGEGFCAQCSSQTKCVPSRNWYTHVRVCDTCYNNNDEAIEYSEDVNARKVTETVVSTLSTVGTVLNYSKSFIKDTARPSYWVPDSEIVSCCICNQKFSVVATLHHCRDCGRGVCENCSQHRNPVPSRGWDKPVRVCDSCRKIH